MLKAFTYFSTALQVQILKSPSPEKSPCPRWLLVLLVAGALFILTLLLCLCCYAQPLRDDYISYDAFADKGFWEGIWFHYLHFNGRLFSALLMHLSPLQFQSFVGYKWICAGYVLAFAGMCWLLTRHLLPPFTSVRLQITICAAAYISVNLALANWAEFYFWLPAISCYGSAFLLAGALILLFPKGIYPTSKPPALKSAVMLLICSLLPLCSEVGTLSGLLILGLAFLKGWQGSRHIPVHLILCLGVLLLAAVVAALSPGNLLRMATSPYKNPLVEITGLTVYTTIKISIRALFYALPPTVLIISVLKIKTREKSKSRLFLLPVILCLILFFVGTTVAVVGLGGLPDLRVRNALLLFLLMGMALCGSQYFLLPKRPSPAISGSLQKTYTAISGMWIAAALLLSGTPAITAFQDLISGIPQRYNADMLAVYQTAKASESTEKIYVAPVREIPASLYIAQPLITPADTAGWNYWNAVFAGYFKKKYLFSDSLAVVPVPNLAMKTMLTHLRARKK